MHALLRLLMLGLCCLAMAACGDDGDSSSGDSGSGGTDVGTDPTGPDPGCDESYPTAYSLGDEMDGYAHACTRGFTHIRIENVSESYLKASVLSAGTVHREIPGTELRFEVDGPIVIAADSTQALESDHLMVVTLKVDWDATIAANVRKSIRERFEALLKPRGEQWAARVSSCTDAAGQAVQAHDYVEDAVRDVLDTGPCVGLIRDLLQADGAAATESELASTRQEVLSAAREIAGGTWKDELINLAARIHR